MERLEGYRLVDAGQSLENGIFANGMIDGYRCPLYEKLAEPRGVHFDSPLDRSQQLDAALVLPRRIF